MASAFCLDALLVLLLVYYRQIFARNLCRLPEDEGGPYVTFTSYSSICQPATLSRPSAFGLQPNRRVHPTTPGSTAVGLPSQPTDGIVLHTAPTLPRSAR